MFSVEELSASAQVWHQLLLRRLRSHGGADGRVTMNIDTELGKLCRRGEEIEWEMIRDVQAALDELSRMRWSYTVPGEADTKLAVGPVWNIIDMVLTADPDWTVEDETTWCVAEVTVQVGKWWAKEEPREHARNQIKLF